MPGKAKIPVVGAVHYIISQGIDGAPADRATSGELAQLTASVTGAALLPVIALRKIE